MNMTQPPAIPAGAVPVPPKGKGLAITAFVFGLLGLIPLIGLPLALVGLILGIIALSKGSGANGLAIAGVVTGGIGLVLLPIFAAIALPAFVNARQAAQGAACCSNMKMLAMECLAYANDHDGRLPNSLDELDQSDRLQCPAKRTTPGPCYKLVLAGAKLSEITDPGETPMIVEPALSHRRGSNVAYADGHVAFSTGP